MRLFATTLVLLAGCSSALAPTPETPSEPAPTADIITEWTDQTTCVTDADCSAVEYGCGGGHTMCTSDPARYEGMMSTCDIVENHPSSQGYACGCATTCVWKK